MNLAQEFLAFVNGSPSPFHAVHNAKQRLLSSGFVELKEKNPWNISPKGKYFFTRNQSTLIAFALGKNYKPGNGVSILGAHTDSPCLKLKPVSKKESCGYLQVGVQLYGGGLWHTWFDRDLGVAGRVIIRSNDGLESRLVKIDRPILRIPTLAIHLDRTANDKFEFNKENQLTPVLATAVKAKLNEPVSVIEGEKHQHHPVLLKIIGDDIGVEISSIVDFELCLFDTQASVTGGLFNEFIFSPRLDNLFMSFCSLKALLDSVADVNSLDNEENIRLVALFDNEEVGSETAQGAASSLLTDVLRRFSSQGREPELFERSIHKSILVSADMAHAVHPNYSEKHEFNHQPKFHEGVVIKTNANQRYATTSITAAIFKQIAKYDSRTGKERSPCIPLQEFVVKNDSPCGSTIGPILSANLGLRTIDVGCPQLSMHSIREMAAVDDLKHAVDLFHAFYNDYPSVDASFIAE